MNWVMRFALVATMASIIAGTALSQSFEVSPASRKALGIATSPILAESGIDGSTTFGTVVAPPGTSHPVISPFDGVLLEPLVIPGMQVKSGQPVALLYSPDYATARSELEAQRIMAEHMDHLYERTTELRALGLRSAQEEDEAEHDSKTAHLELAASQARLNAVRSARGAGRYQLVAPASGIVSEITVGAGEPVGISEPFLSVFDGSSYWLDVALPERLAKTVSIGSSVNLPGVAGKGKVVAIDPKVDARLQSVRIKIELPTSPTWRLGQLVDLTLETQNQVASMLVPARALVRIAGTDCVFVETTDGFRRVNVEVLARNRDEVILRGDLTNGDQVAISGLAALKNLVEGA